MLALPLLNRGVTVSTTQLRTPIMSSLPKLKLTAAIAALLAPFTASATPYYEIGDAGQSLATAQAVTGGTHVIYGNAGNGVDLFSFYWGGGAFYVNSVGSTGDSQLFLFNSTGVGVLGNDDGIAIAGPAYLQTTALASGQYYLGISGYDNDPYSSSGIMFQSYPYQPVYGPSNLDPLTGWSGGGGLGAYQINFQQITSEGNPIGNPTPIGSVPDHASSAALLGLGFAGLALMRRQKKA